MVTVLVPHGQLATQLVSDVLHDGGGGVRGGSEVVVVMSGDEW